MATGTVHVWSKSRGSGWIKPDSGGNRVYVHRSGIDAESIGATRLETGQRVEYQIGQRPRGAAAINVRFSDTEATPRTSADDSVPASAAAAPAASEA